MKTSTQTALRRMTSLFLVFAMMFGIMPLGTSAQGAEVFVQETLTTEDTDGETTDDDEDVTEDDDETSGDATVTGISLSTNSVVLSTESGTTSVKLTAQVTMSDGNDAPSSILSALQWTSSNESVVTLSAGESSGASNLYNATSAGETTITVSYGGYSDTCKITVSGITLLVEGETEMNTNSTKDITVKRYGDASTVTWTSTNSSLFTVEQTEVNQNDNTTTATMTTSTATGSAYLQIATNDGATMSVPVTVSESTAEVIEPSYNVNIITPLKFSDLADAFNDRSQAVHYQDIESITNVQVTTTEGILYVGYQNEDNPGAGIATIGVYSFTTSPSAKDIVFVPNSSYTGNTATITYTGTTVKGNTFNGEILVTLGAIDDVITDTTVQEPVDLTSYAFSQVASKSGKIIDTIVFALPDENKALLYYDYNHDMDYHHQIIEGEEFELEQIDKITVIPSPGFYGTLSIPYVITATDGGKIIGTASVLVENYGPEGPVVYNTISGQHVNLTTSDFHDNVNAITGYNMSYITLSLPDPSEGVLYEQYNSSSDFGGKVLENTPYYASSRSPEISSISFMPTAGYTGSVKIPFVGYDTQGTSYGGTIEINVGTQVLGDITYICSANSYVPFYEGDFNRFSQLHTGENAGAISFPELPAVHQGSIRLGQTSYQPGYLIEENSEYYYSSTPNIGKLSFQAATSYNGFVSIPFEGISVSGIPFAGTISIIVSNQNLVKIPYTASHYKPAEFDSIDFDHYAVERTGTTLDYVRFELPDAGVGSLYYNYVSEDDYAALVNAATNYYVNQSHFLNSVCFVPHRDFQGTAEIKFTGWGTNGQSFSGILSVYVADSGDPLTYYMYTGDSIYLNSSALNDYCKGETGSALNYITITNPSTTYGRLYRDYLETDTSHVAATSTTRFYKSQSPYINNVAFVPATGFIGTVQLPFTAVAVDGSTCTGIIHILVRPSSANDNVYYYTSFSPIQVNEKDIYDVWGSEDINYIEIHNLPTTTQGKLYYENKLTSLASTNYKYYTTASNTGPYISQMVFAPRAGFSGTMIISYTATTVQGRTFSGDICVVVTTGQNSIYFNDMKDHLWATSSVDYLCLTSVSTGTGMGGFSPSNYITRGDYALMLCNAFRFTSGTTTEFSDVPSSAYYATAVHTLRALGIAGGYNNKFNPTSYISRQDAVVMLEKAMEVANKDIVYAYPESLSHFHDVSSIASYATQSFANMVATGILSGNNGYLYPTQNITRAEMAVILHQAMTC